ncbi:collagen alpha-1(I) chain-like [Ammospiza nelsoni]|uniref:collagen alpha-1(I) chain-like n=1 Tax=Ammospiza nelsoni TaxID=2857394 RepID=UPI00286BA1D0|nr:collagen alpha-1(I) chain-like [Ammospiza nelsoni]
MGRGEGEQHPTHPPKKKNLKIKNIRRGKGRRGIPPRRLPPSWENGKGSGAAAGARPALPCPAGTAAPAAPAAPAAAPARGVHGGGSRHRRDTGAGGNRHRHRQRAGRGARGHPGRAAGSGAPAITLPLHPEPLTRSRPGLSPRSHRDPRPPNRDRAGAAAGAAPVPSRALPARARCSGMAPGSALSPNELRFCISSLTNIPRGRAWGHRDARPRPVPSNRGFPAARPLPAGPGRGGRPGLGVGHPRSCGSLAVPAPGAAVPSPPSVCPGASPGKRRSGRARLLPPPGTGGPAAPRPRGRGFRGAGGGFGLLDGVLIKNSLRGARRSAMNISGLLQNNRVGARGRTHRGTGSARCPARPRLRRRGRQEGTGQLRSVGVAAPVLGAAPARPRLAETGPGWGGRPCRDTVTQPGVSPGTGRAELSVGTAGTPGMSPRNGDTAPEGSIRWQALLWDGITPNPPMAGTDGKVPDPKLGCGSPRQVPAADKAPLEPPEPPEQRGRPGGACREPGWTGMDRDGLGWTGPVRGLAEPRGGHAGPCLGTAPLCPCPVPPPHPEAAAGPWCHPWGSATLSARLGTQGQQGRSEGPERGWGHPRAPPEPGSGPVATGGTGAAGTAGMCGSRRSRPALGAAAVPGPGAGSAVSPPPPPPPPQPPAPPRGSPRPDISWRSFHASGLP